MGSAIEGRQQFGKAGGGYPAVQLTVYHDRGTAGTQTQAVHGGIAEFALPHAECPRLVE